MFILPREIMERIQSRLAFLYGAERASRLTERLALLASRYEVCGLGCNDRDKPVWDQGDTLLITYADMVKSAGEPPLRTLYRFLSRHLKGVISDVHILPFYPSSSDEGFAVIDFRAIDPRYGGWDDMHALGRDFRLMFDLVINHASTQSKWFEHFQSGVAPERDYFIVLDPDTDLSSVVRPRANPLLTPVDTPRDRKWVWTTYSADQADLNFANQDVLFEFLDILLFYVFNGGRMIRLDAIAYLWKELGTSCINLPQTHEVVKLLRDILEMLAPRCILLTATNLPQSANVSYFGDGDEAHMVYQYSLPPLLLHALYTGSSEYLAQWARTLPEPPPGCSFVNFTASHDGIGVRPLEGLVPEEGVRELVDNVTRRGGKVSYRISDSGEETPYELNITYFDALAEPGHTDTDLHINRFLCSQTVMLALRGIPAVYFHSLTATHNDYGTAEHSGHARDINRSRWTEDKLDAQLNDPATTTHRVFHEYLRRLKLRGAHPAFHPEARQRILNTGKALFGVERVAPSGEERIIAVANLSSRAQKLKGKLVNPNDAQGTWRELIHGFETQITATTSLDLAPYDTLWLVEPGGET